MQNHFATLGLTPHFEVAESALNKAYIAAQQAAHPDRMVGKSDAEKLVAIQSSMDANEAYETLKNPLTRAQHLLSLQGVQVNVDGPDAVRPSPALLAEMLELREELADVRTEESIAKWAHATRGAMSECTTMLKLAFDAKDYTEAAQLTIRLRYLGKALEEAMAKQYRVAG